MFLLIEVATFVVKPATGTEILTDAFIPPSSRIMGLYKKKNIFIGAIGRLMFPEALWTRRFLVAWLGCLLTVVAFDLLWSLPTNPRALAYVGTYVNGILLATVLALPAVASRRAWPQLVVLLLADCVLAANLMYAAAFYSSIPLDAYPRVASLLDFTGAVGTRFSWWYLVLPAIAVATYLLMQTGDDNADEPRPNIIFYTLTLGILALLAAGVAAACGGLTQHVERLRSSYNGIVAPVVYTVPGVLIAESLEVPDPITPDQQKFVAQWGRNHVALRSAMGEPADTMVRRDNLVMIFWESLESWPIGVKVEGKELTPNINRMLRDTTLRSFYAPRVLSQAAAGLTSDGQLLALAGMHPTHSGAFAMTCSDNRFHTLPDAMKQQGARTYLLSGDRPWRWNAEMMARAFGIDHIHLRDSWNTSERINGDTPSDNAVISQAIAKMQRGEVWPEGEKAYVQINTLSGHAPFRIPAELQTIALDGGYPAKLRDYMTAVHYTDQAVGRLLDYLRQRPDWNRTMVVITGDHEALSHWRSALRSDATGAKLIEAEEYVPLVVLNAPIAGRRASVMGQIDIYPTLLDEMGLDYRWRGMGFSALAQRSPAFAVSHRGRIVGDTSDFGSQVSRHVEDALTVSDLIIRHDLLEE